SFVSIEQARTNLQMQTQLKSFDAIRETVQQKWLNEISRFDVNAHWNHEAVVKFNSPIVHSLSSFTPEMPKGHFFRPVTTRPGQSIAWPVLQSYMKPKRYVYFYNIFIRLNFGHDVED
ncbi:unnamed protein product, partial [Rotaria magnacalcarata]